MKSCFDRGGAQVFTWKQSDLTSSVTAPFIRKSVVPFKDISICTVLLSYPLLSVCQSCFQFINRLWFTQCL